MNPEKSAGLGLTRHAQSRAQERSIPAFVIELLLSFGAAGKAPGGAEKLFFDRTARRNVKSLLGGDRGVRLVERWFNTCAILGHDGRIVTLYRE